MNLIEELTKEVKILEEIRDLHRSATSMVFPGEVDSPGAYMKILKQTEKERDKFKGMYEIAKSCLINYSDHENYYSCIYAQEALSKIERLFGDK